MASGFAETSPIETTDHRHATRSVLILDLDKSVWEYNLWQSFRKDIAENYFHKNIFRKCWEFLYWRLSKIAKFWMKLLCASAKLNKCIQYPTRKHGSQNIFTLLKQNIYFEVAVVSLEMVECKEWSWVFIIMCRANQPRVVSLAGCILGYSDTVENTTILAWYCHNKCWVEALPKLL